MPILFSALTFLLASFSLVPPVRALVIVRPYLSGPEFCEIHKSSIEKEFSFRVPVPVSYSDPTQGTETLYAWTQEKWNSDWPTAVFVVGGPGATSHEKTFDLPGWNVVFFDQRGNTCSRPSTQARYLDRTFYSSENTARDIEEIRKHLNVPTLSIYGHSYGTIPAHLYAHFFPDRTRALVLEGVIFQSDEFLFGPQRRARILQRFYESLPPDLKEKIQKLSNQDDVPKNWFSVIGLNMLYLDDGASAYRQFLETILADDASARAMISNFIPVERDDAQFGSGDVMMGHLGCQELSMNVTGTSFFLVFNGKQELVSDGFNHLQQLYCKTLGYNPNEPNRTFFADQFPIKVPVTYFQGSWDGATVASHAVRHWKRAARGPAQLLLMSHGGHAPMLGRLTGYESAETVRLHQNTLRMALSGGVLPASQIKLLNQVPGAKWVFTRKPAAL